MGFLARLMGLLASTYYFVGSLSVASPAAGLHMLWLNWSVVSLPGLSRDVGVQLFHLYSGFFLLFGSF